MEASDTLFSVKIFFLWRAFTLFRVLVVDLLEWTLWTILYWYVKISVIAWTEGALFIHQNRRALWASPAIVFFNMIDLILGTGLTFFWCVIEIVGKIAANTSFRRFIWKWIWTLASLRLWIELFIEWTFFACFVLLIEKEWKWTWNALALCLKWSFWITETFLACNVVCWTGFTRLTVKCFIVPLRIYWAWCALLAGKEWIFLRTRSALLSVDVENLSFRAGHACQATKIKILWMKAEYTCFIVPKISFFIRTLTLKGLHV